METSIEKIIKLILFFTVVLAIILYWLLPKTKLARHFKMNESLFVATNIIGVICGITGLVVTLALPQFIIELHLWELILLPFALVYIYWALIMRIRKSAEIVDEKQDYNMAQAAGFTMGFTILAMVVMFIFYENNIFSGSVWFPYYFFVTLLLFSASSLLFFKKA